MSDLQTVLAVGQLLALVIVPIVAVTTIRTKLDALTKSLDRLSKKLDRLDSRVDLHAVDIAVLKSHQPNGRELARQGEAIQETTH